MSGIIIDPYRFAAGYANDNCFDFDGTDELFTTGLSLAYASVPTWSISYWIKTSATLTAWASYFAIGVNVSSGAYNYAAGRLYVNLATLVVGIQGSGSSYGSTQLNDGDWHNIVQVYTDNGGTQQRVRIFVDGGTTAEADLANTLSFLPLTSDLFIGCRDAAYDRGWPGRIDEVAVWNTDKSGDVAAIYNSGTPDDLSGTSPLAYYRMGENGVWDGSKWDLTDQGSGGNDAESDNMEEADRVVPSYP